jgi:hypothetical protein
LNPGRPDALERMDAANAKLLLRILFEVGVDKLVQPIDNCGSEVAYALGTEYTHATDAPRGCPWMADRLIASEYDRLSKFNGKGVRLESLDLPDFSGIHLHEEYAQ